MDETGSLRERRQEQTRFAIVDAYLDLAHRDGAVTISVPAVAREAGVSVRTVYRYFPSKDELATAAAYRMSDQALFGASMDDTTAASLPDNLKMLWVGLADRLPAVIAEHATPAGREIRQTRLRSARNAAAASLPDHADEETADLVVAVTSSSMFLELVDRMGYAPEVAASMAVRLAILLLNDAQESPPNTRGDSS